MCVNPEVLRLKLCLSSLHVEKAIPVLKLWKYLVIKEIEAYTEKSVCFMATHRAIDSNGHVIR